MQNRTSAKEKHLFYNTLSCLIKGLENYETIIDLRNEMCVSGVISAVDAFMNVEMENVVLYDARDKQHHFKNFFVNSRNIRYIHIPKKLLSRELIETQLMLFERSSKPSFDKPRGYKIKRAERYNNEITEELRRQQSRS